VDEESTATSSSENSVVGNSSGQLQTSDRLLLFYKYMLPHFTAEAYSWADPENDDSGFKTGVENCFSLIKDGVFASLHVLHQQWILH